MRKSKIDWSGVDWSKQDVVLAEELGVSRERVRQMRPEGLISENYRQRSGVTAEQRIAGMVVEGKTVDEVARAAGCGEAWAGMVMRDQKKGYKRKSTWNSRYDWSLLPANWREVSDKVMAGMVGASSPAVVTQWRIRHGMRKRVGT